MPGLPTDEGTTLVVVPSTDYLWFVDRALDDMCAVVEALGDELVNRRPPFRDVNSAYVILTHCLGVMEYWGGATVAQRPIQRDRAAEAELARQRPLAKTGRRDRRATQASCR